MSSDKTELDVLRQKIADLVAQDPAKAAIILTEWLNGAPSSPKSRKAG